MSYPNKLVTMCLPYEHKISQVYGLEVARMIKGDGTRNEFKWGVWCDQDQLYYAVYEVVPGLEEAHERDDKDGELHNQFTQWLNAVFELVAARHRFNGDV